MSSESALIVPIILSGGVGSRLWPLSRSQYPKQLLALTGERTLLQLAADRVADSAVFTAPLVVSNTEHRFVVAEQLHGTGARVVLEPVGRNTAAAICAAAMLVAADQPDAMLLVLPADHIIRQPEALTSAVRAARPVAQQGAIVTFGVVPTAPATGFGYVMAEGSADTVGTRRVGRFIEKPPVETARTLIQSGDAYWNAGIFMFTARTIMEAVHQHLPKVYTPVARAVAGASEDLDFLRLAEADFAAAESISIDYGVMERADQISVMPVDVGWSDVGSWRGLWEVSAQDPAGNVALGDVRLHDCHASFVRAEGPMVVAVGLKDTVVITTPDAVLVAALDATDGLKRAVAALQDDGRVEADMHRTVHRPWGSFTTLHFGHRFQVKQLSVKPGASLSLQKHYHRAEHWVVVAGTAQVTVGGQQQLLAENESAYIPLGSVHRVENPGKIPLHMIEVQSGAYLGEDDIVRIEDRYARIE